MVQGVNRFLQNSDGLQADLPMLASWFYQTVISVLIEEKVLSVGQIKWTDTKSKVEEDDEVEVDVRLKVLSLILVREAQNSDV